MQTTQAVVKLLPNSTAFKAPLNSVKLEKLLGIFSAIKHVDAKNDSLSTQLTRMQPGAMLLVTERLPVTN